MNNGLKAERLKYKGRLVELENQADNLKLTLGHGLRTMRDMLDPTEALDAIEGEAVANLAIQFAQKQIELRAALSKIETIKEALGG